MGPSTLLRDPSYLKVWVSGGFIGTMRWLEILVIAVYTLEATGSPLMVAIMMLARALPMFLFGAVTGAVAERINRRHIMIVVLFSATLVSSALGVLALSGLIEVWHIALGAFLSGMVWTMEFPVRRTMLGEIAGPLGVGAGMSLDSATTNGTRMLGPLLGGLLYETIGLPGAYWLGACLYLLGGFLFLSLDYASTASPPREKNLLSTIAVGLRFVRGNRAIVGMLAVTVIMNLWGFSFTAMVPVIGRDVLGLSAFPIGVLMSAEGAGAFIGALIIAGTVRPILFNKIYLYGSALMMTGVVMFSFSTTFPLSLGLLFVAGLGAAGFSAMQTAIMFTLAPPEMRGRVMGVLSVCIGASPLGMLHIGLMASWLTPSDAVLLVTLEGIVALAAAAFIWKELRR